MNTGLIQIVCTCDYHLNRVQWYQIPSYQITIQYRNIFAMSYIPSGSNSNRYHISWKILYREIRCSNKKKIDDHIRHLQTCVTNLQELGSTNDGNTTILIKFQK